MIIYPNGTWGLSVLLMRRGSVLPKALVWSIPCVLGTVILHLYWEGEKGDENAEMEGIQTVWSSFSFVLGFLIVFRSNQAYSRFWESVTLFHQMTGEWMSAFSNLLAFLTLEEDRQTEVAEFRQLIIRLMSLMHCNALQTTCELEDDSLEVLDLGGFDRQSILHLKSSPDRCESVLLWIECLIIQAERRQVLDVPAPILSRSFQELSRGMVSLTNLRKIRDVPKPWWAGLIVFAVTTAFWTLFYIAQEIDQPFGEDANDLPVRDMQRNFNSKLEYFVKPTSWRVPELRLDASQQVKVLRSTYSYALSEAQSTSDEITIPQSQQEDAPQRQKSWCDGEESSTETTVEMLKGWWKLFRGKDVDLDVGHRSSGLLSEGPQQPVGPHTTPNASATGAMYRNPELDPEMPFEEDPSAQIAAREPIPWTEELKPSILRATSKQVSLD